MNNKSALLFTALLVTLLLAGCRGAAAPSFPDEAQSSSLEAASLEASPSAAGEESSPVGTSPETEESLSHNEPEINALPLIVMVNDTLYLDTGSLSDTELRCGMMDGQITSEVAGSEIPTQNDQSNFGTGYGYQYGAGASIDVYMPYGASAEMHWVRFVRENPVEKDSKEDISLTSAPSLTLRNYLTDDTFSLVLRSGNYTWYSQIAEEMTSQIACGSHPLDEAALHPSVLTLLPQDTSGTSSFSFSFSGNVYPDSLTIRKWSQDDIGNPQAQPLLTSAFMAPLPLLELEPGYVYEITAEWKQENVPQNGCYGTASYVLVTE